MLKDLFSLITNPIAIFVIIVCFVVGFLTNFFIQNRKIAKLVLFITGILFLLFEIASYHSWSLFSGDGYSILSVVSYFLSLICCFFFIGMVASSLVRRSINNKKGHDI